MMTTVCVLMNGFAVEDGEIYTGVLDTWIYLQKGSFLTCLFGVERVSVVT